VKIPPLFEVVQQAILGFLSAAVVSGIWWLVTGSLPDGMELWAGSFTVMWAGSVFLRVQKAREVRALREMYDRPASDEK
jgi:hypothetical protein